MRDRFATIAALAGTRHGRVDARLLREAGVDAQCTSRWVAAGLLHRVHVGVYAVGHKAPSVDGDWMAAVLAGGEGAVLSHSAVAHKRRLRRGPPPPPEITVPTTAHRRRPGIVIHRVRAIDVLDVETVDDIPMTTVPRTLLDLAPRLDLAELTRLCHEAWVQHRVSPRLVEACIARNPHKKGVAKLRAALGSDATLSRLEDGFLALLRAHSLPAPRTNVDRNGDKVDCWWPQLDLTVELLSYRFHGSRRAFEADVARRRRSGHIAFTWGDVFERPTQTIAELGTAMRPYAQQRRRR